MERLIEEAAEIIVKSKYVTALTGAGISVESGIPPFRGPGGLWTKYGEPPMDGYQRFLADPRGAWERRLKREGYLKEIYETIEKAKPNPSHYALARLEELGVLKFLITQNVDNLHREAGSRNIAEIHGNYLLLRCIECHMRYNRDEISLEELPPRCPHCGGIVKWDTVAFGEPIPPDVLAKCQEETLKSDCMLVIGTSAVVYPAASFPKIVRARGGALIEVNLYDTDLTPLCWISLRGKCGEVMPKLVEAVEARLKGR